MSDLPAILGAIRDNADTSARLLVAAEALRSAQDSARSAPPANSGASTATVHVSAGGWFSGVAIALAMICVLIQARGAFAQAQIDSRMEDDIRELRAENRRINDYLSALYRQRPDLKPENLQKGKK